MPHDQNSTLPLDWHNGTCLFHSLLFTVVKECTKQAAVEVIQDGDEEELIKLKGRGKLRTHYKEQKQVPKTSVSISWLFIFIGIWLNDKSHT